MISGKAHIECIRDEKTDQQLAVALVALYFIHFINNTAKGILPIPDFMWSLMSYAGFALGGVLVVLVLPKALKRYPMAFIVVEAAGIILYCTSMIQNHDNLSIVLGRAFWTLGICIPMGYLAYAVYNKQILYNVMLKASYYMTALISLVFFFNWFSSPGTYNMSFSYALLYPLLFHLDALSRKRDIVHLILSTYQILLILLYGSRGAVLCFSIFIIIKIVLSTKSTVRKTAIVGLGGLTVILFYVNFEAIGNSVLRAMSQNGYYSRTLNSFFNGSILQSSGRDSIRDKALDMIMRKPWTGWGMGGEIDLLGTYPHNLFIEVLLNFGILMGGIACILVVANVIRVFFLHDGILQSLLFIYLCAGFIPLLLSSTYLKQYEFFIFLFLCIQANRKKAAHGSRTKDFEFMELRANI